MKEKAVKVPLAMQGCIPLPKEELLLLRDLLNRALSEMDEKSGQACRPRLESTGDADKAEDQLKSIF